MIFEKWRHQLQSNIDSKKTLPLIMVTTSFAQTRQYYLERATLVLKQGQRELTYDQRNRCERRAVEKAAPNAQVLCDYVHDQGVDTFTRTIRDLGGTV